MKKGKEHVGEDQNRQVQEIRGGEQSSTDEFECSSSTCSKSSEACWVTAYDLSFYEEVLSHFSAQFVNEVVSYSDS